MTGYFYFDDGENINRTIESMYVTNTSYYLGTVGTLATDTDWTKITATGYDGDGKVTGTSEFYLTENGKSINEWTRWDLTSLSPLPSRMNTAWQYRHISHTTMLPSRHCFLMNKTDLH